MIQLLDPNVVQFEILPHLDDRSVISLLSTSKLIYQVISISEYVETKLKLMDKEILSQEFNELEHSPMLVNRINRIFRLAYLNFREMFRNEKKLVGIVKVDEAQCYDQLKAQYTLLKRYVFNTNQDKQLTTHCNRSVFSAKSGFWNSHDVNFKISKENTVYYWSIVLTAFDRKISNSWTLLIGFSAANAVSSISESWISSGYCVKSNAILENRYTSYTESFENTEGDVIGIECYKQNQKVFFNVYTALGNQHNFQFKSVEEQSIVPMVSLVHSPSSLQLVSILPWDGHVETLKSFGSQVVVSEKEEKE